MYDFIGPSLVTLVTLVMDNHVAKLVLTVFLFMFRKVSI